MPKHCRVRGCRFPHSHVTGGHVCGSCGQRGHGVQECGKESLIERLYDYFGNDMVEDHCTVEGCDDPHTHSTSGHHCKRCNVRTTDSTCCNTILENCVCPICRCENHFVNLSRKVYAQGSECVVCFNEGPLVLFDTCGHVCVCSDCARRL